MSYDKHGRNFRPFLVRLDLIVFLSLRFLLGVPRLHLFQLIFEGRIVQRLYCGVPANGKFVLFIFEAVNPGGLLVALLHLVSEVDLKVLLEQI